MAAFSEDYDQSARAIPAWFVILCLVGGGIFFFKNFNISGLDGISVHPKQTLDTGDEEFITYRSSTIFPETTFVGTSHAPATEGENPFQENPQVIAKPRKRFRNIRIASWALEGFNPTKLANPIARRNLIRVIRQFDIVALQQVSSQERDLIPRIADEANEAGRHYDYVMSDLTGPRDSPEQLAFIFDTGRVQVDRSQTYTVDDPNDNLLYDPLVAWFQTVQPTQDYAWTFSLVNVRVDLGHAREEVALLPNIMAAVRMDGRGEDDVVMTGLFQADDAYLLPTIAGDDVRAAVRSVPTDIFGRHQTSNILMDTKLTSEYIGRGGAFDFVRAYTLNTAEAQTITSHLPVFAEFTANEGGRL